MIVMGDPGRGFHAIQPLTGEGRPLNQPAAGNCPSITVLPACRDLLNGVPAHSVPGKNLFFY